MHLRQIMTQNIEIVELEDSVLFAAEKMRYRDIGAVIVCDGGKPVGMVTDRDIAIRCAAKNFSPDQTRVGDVMTPLLITCNDDATPEKCAELMEKYRIRRMVVLDRQKLPVGIVSLGDIAARSKNEKLCGEILRIMFEPRKEKIPEEFCWT